MRIYIILTCEVHPIGGAQTYTAAKTRYLELKGYKTIVFYDGPKAGNCKVKELNKYTRNGFAFLAFAPENFNRKMVNRFLGLLISRIKKTCATNLIDDEIYIESHYSSQALWGELLAERIGANHIGFLCNEQFNDSYYREYIDFFYYKYEKNELYGINKESMKRLFKNHYSNIDEEHVFEALEDGDVQDVGCTKLSKIKKGDYINVCYIGRATKGYVTNILNGVCAFADRHKDKKIQFIIVGDSKSRKQEITKLFKNKRNVTVVQLGDLVPLPQALSKKIDVVMAGSGCAISSAFEGVPVIVADCNNYLSNGVLGYTVDNAFNSHRQENFEETLENVLITKDYLKETYCFQRKRNPEEVFGSHLKKYLNCNGTYYCTYQKEHGDFLNYLKYSMKMFVYGIYVYIK